MTYILCHIPSFNIILPYFIKKHFDFYFCLLRCYTLLLPFISFCDKMRAKKARLPFSETELLRFTSMAEIAVAQISQKSLEYGYFDIGIAENSAPANVGSPSAILLLLCRQCPHDAVRQSLPAASGLYGVRATCICSQIEISSRSSSR